MLSSIFLLAALQQQTHQSFHPSAHRVVSGETLSGIAPSMGESWQRLYAANQRVIGGNPNLIYPGEVLYSGPVTRSVTVHSSSWEEPAKPAPAASDTGSYGHPYYCGDGDGDGYDVPCPTQHTAVAPASSGSDHPVTASATYTGSSSIQQCIIARESGGNSQIWNASGHYGLYQFSAETWSGSGGNPADFGHASVAEQNQVFANAVAARGYSDWAPYDGC